MYEDSENIEAYCVNTVVFNLQQIICQAFFGTPDTLLKIAVSLLPLQGYQLFQSLLLSASSCHLKIEINPRKTFNLLEVEMNICIIIKRQCEILFKRIKHA